MISKTSKEKFVMSKFSEEKVQSIREIYDAVFQNPGNGLAELPIIMNLRLTTDLRNEKLASRMAIAITRKSRNSFSGESEFRVIVFGPIYKNDSSEFFCDIWNHAWK